MLLLAICKRSIRRQTVDQSARLIRPGLEGDNGYVIHGFLLSVMLLALLLLAAACANLASLFAARAADRGRELALRVALGSSRQRLLRQLLTEAMLVSLLGGAVGMLCAASLLNALSRWQPFGAGSEHLVVAVDARVYLAGLALSMTSGLLFGMIPAWHAWQSRPLQAMKSAPAESGHSPPICNTGLAARGANCNLYPAGYGFAGGRSGNDAGIARSTRN